jgi:hypothetical protein
MNSRQQFRFLLQEGENACDNPDNKQLLLDPSWQEVPAHGAALFFAE